MIKEFVYFGYNVKYVWYRGNVFYIYRWIDWIYMLLLMICNYKVEKRVFESVKDNK